MKTQITRAFAEAIIKKYQLNANAVEIGGEWCLEMTNVAEAQELCALFGTSGWQGRDAFIVCNLREQPYKPQIRF